jgi:hypothetical protein
MRIVPGAADNVIDVLIDSITLHPLAELPKRCTVLRVAASGVQLAYSSPLWRSSDRKRSLEPTRLQNVDGPVDRPCPPNFPVICSGYVSERREEAGIEGNGQKLILSRDGRARRLLCEPTQQAAPEFAAA